MQLADSNLGVRTGARPACQEERQNESGDCTGEESAGIPRHAGEVGARDVALGTVVAVDDLARFAVPRYAIAGYTLVGILVNALHATVV